MDYQLFTIPASDSFAFAIRSHRALVQPFPLEMIDSLLAVRRTAIEQAKKAIREYLADAETEFKEGTE
jgi:hypothetical protein